MKLTNEDKNLLRRWGFEDQDFPQIEEALKAKNTKYEMGGDPIGRDAALNALGRRAFLSGISRSAFHYTAAREATDGRIVLFVSIHLFS